MKTEKFLQTPQAFLLLAAGAMALLMWGTTLFAGWGLIDDHEIVWLIGEGDHLPLDHFRAALSRTEIASDASFPRYRPVYFGLRLVEAMIWGKNSHGWYLLRAAIGVSFALSLALLISNFGWSLGRSLGVLVLLIGGGYWSDIFARAGPSEVYAVLGLAISFFAVHALYQAPRFELNLAQSVALALGLVLVIGSKENLLIFMVIPVLILGAVWFAHTRVAVWPIFFLPLALGVWIVWTLFHRLSVSGTDIYANSVSVSDRLSNFLVAVKIPFLWAWIASWLFVFIFRRSQALAQGSSFLGTWRTAIYCNVGLFVIFLFQITAYGGSWPLSTIDRYLFPGVLCVQLGALLLLQQVIRQPLISNERTILRKAAISLCLITFISVSTVGSKFPLLSNVKESVKLVHSTRELQQKYESLVSDLKNDPARMLVVDSHDVWDSEPIESLVRFLRSDGVRNKVVLRVSYRPEEFTPESLEWSLAKDKSNIEKNGVGEFSANIGSYSNCIAVGMSGDPSVCEKGFKIWPYR
ncbi:hypothetical protein KIK84_16420 [Curvibacter sp. CHRR-16]|uniref:hypothetical protein n=1 Tax=Curvibacter sp. CHRR-16 TaxID=2835872 RepID=UPI001BDB15A3|nr:hypothetical protein [Curvibacter sp. CHRR-16]MBT0571901.1 hypothetical protein [Curvibacter sp. CHRR-16]